MVLSSIAKKHFPKTEVLLFDERFTTREAKLLQKSLKRYYSIDSLAAQCLLDRYFEDKGKGSIKALPCDYPIPKELEMFDYNILKQYLKVIFNSFRY